MAINGAAVMKESVLMTFLAARDVEHPYKHPKCGCLSELNLNFDSVEVQINSSVILKSSLFFVVKSDIYFKISQKKKKSLKIQKPGGYSFQ